MANEHPQEGTAYERSIMKTMEIHKPKRLMYRKLVFVGTGWKANWVNTLNEQYLDGYEWLPPFMVIGTDNSQVTSPDLIQAIFKDVSYGEEFQNYIGLVNSEIEENFRSKRQDSNKKSSDGRAKKQK